MLEFILGAFVGREFLGKESKDTVIVREVQIQKEEKREEIMESKKVSSIDDIIEEF